MHFEDAIRLGFIGVHSCLMYRRSSREPLRFDQKLLDIYLTWDLLSKGSGYVLKDVLGRYRVGASGSLTVSSSKMISQLAIKHAQHFIDMFPKQRKNYFIWAITTAIIDAKNARSTAMYFIYFSMKNISMVSPKDILNNLHNMWKIRVRWKDRGPIDKKEN